MINDAPITLILINRCLITEPENRAFRYGMLHIITSLGSPIASPIGAYLLKKGGYICVFSTELTCFILGALILIWRLHRFKWSPPKTTVISKHEHMLCMTSANTTNKYSKVLSYYFL